MVLQILNRCDLSIFFSFLLQIDGMIVRQLFGLNREEYLFLFFESLGFIESACIRKTRSRMFHGWISHCTFSMLIRYFLPSMLYTLIGFSLPFEPMSPNNLTEYSLSRPANSFISPEPLAQVV